MQLSPLTNITEENSPKFPSIDLKNKLKEKFKQELKFLKPNHFTLTISSEFTVSSGYSVLPNFLYKFLPGCGILKNLLIKNCAKTVSEEIEDYPLKNANGLQHHNKY